MTTTEPAVEPARPPVAAGRPRRSWDTDRIVALSAMAVGLCTLFITLYQTYLTRQAQSASVLPYLVFAINSNDAGAYITLRNDGVGPAMVEDLHIRYRGREHQKDPYDFFLEQQPNANVGEIVVAIVDNEFTVKYLDREKDGFVLKPANKAYPVIRPRGRLEIFGVMAGLVRRTR